MRVLMTSWEYPPHVVGGLGAHVGALAPALARLGVEVHVVTPLRTDSPAYEVAEGVHVHRIAAPGPAASYGAFYDQVRQANAILAEACLALRGEVGGFDLLHNHDWLTYFAAREAKHACHLPLVATIHATERGRGHGNLASTEARSINDTEWWLVYEAWRVICCANYMAGEVQSFFEAPADKLDVIPNGVDPNLFSYLDGVDLSAFRATYARPDEKLVLFVGRIVREKGAEVLVRSAPKVLAEMPNTRFVIAGRGPELEALRQLVHEMSLQHHVNLVGFIDDASRDKLYVTADCAVFPSLYEPFGIVALEAMAAHTPVVASEVGGLQEVVRHAETGITIYPNDPDSCAWGILHTLQHPEWARLRAENAYRAILERYNWDAIARETRLVYERVISERARTDW
ncbi:MAG: glycosyltransferase family 4 protein [Chloroflexi bacterium]|jgi:glycogen(starch) synthase|nr:glycosyltransferase family 4 protein [Chloroflexota bacterium]